LQSSTTIEALIEYLTDLIDAGEVTVVSSTSELVAEFDASHTASVDVEQFFEPNPLPNIESVLV
jgi:hypothetical protein